MASIDSTRPFAAPHGFHLPTAVARVFASLQGWNDARITRKSLSRLSERELDDIGLCRGDIDLIARTGHLD